MSQKLFVVSHTHWDREWYQPFQEFRIRLLKLMDKLLGMLEGDAEYRYFTLDGQTIILEDYLEVRPEREAEVRRYVQEGRLQIGPWYVLKRLRKPRGRWNSNGLRVAKTCGGSRGFPWHLRARAGEPENRLKASS